MALTDGMDTITTRRPSMFTKMDLLYEKCVARHPLLKANMANILLPKARSTKCERVELVPSVFGRDCREQVAVATALSPPQPNLRDERSMLLL